MSMVPLNFGAAAPLMLNPHLVQVVAVSGFLVPQFGQNKSASEDGARPPLEILSYSDTLHARPLGSQASRDSVSERGLHRVLSGDGSPAGALTPRQGAH